MKTKYILSLILIANFIISVEGQEFDAAFLDSLPNDIRADLLEQTNQKDLLEQPQYRRPSTFINKPSGIVSDRFGLNIFSMMQSTLMPLNEPNFDGNYILDFGDILSLQLVGQKNLITKLNIARDGSVNIPEIGKIFLSGIPLNQALELIQNKVKNSFIGVNAFVTLINVRDIQVIVAGNVFNPGPYTLNGNSNIFHALSVSGGPSNLGSFRSIDLIRNNKVIDTIDLYDTFIFGNSSFNTRLRSGDIVFVNPVLNIVSIQGAVKRPASYELRVDENLHTVIKFANNLSALADLNDVSLYRFDKGEVNQIKINQLNDLKNIISQDQDSLKISKFPFRSVSINGAVKNPGTYIVKEGEGIYETVLRAGGYTKSAYPYGGVLNNENTRLINEMAINELYNSFLEELIIASSKSSEQSGLSGITSLMQELKETKTSGRVIASFDVDFLKENLDEDIILQDGDEIIIPELLSQVYVFGEVPSAGTVRFATDEKFGYYIKKKGGYKDSADMKRVFVLQPNGETIALGSKNIFKERRLDIQIHPGSIIFVPRKLDDSLLIAQTAQAYATILGNLGVSLASLSVLKD